MEGSAVHAWSRRYAPMHPHPGFEDVRANMPEPGRGTWSPSTRLEQGGTVDYRFEPGALELSPLRRAARTLCPTTSTSHRTGAGC